MFDKRYVMKEGMEEFYWRFIHVFADEQGRFTLDDVYTYCDEQDIDPLWFLDEVLEDYQRPSDEEFDIED